jgi:undecaprenyl-phosphate galactose phosphotransferase
LQTTGDFLQTHIIGVDHLSTQTIENVIETEAFPSEGSSRAAINQTAQKLSRPKRFVKRFFDIALTLIFLPLWGLVFIFIIMLQKIYNPGKLFFTQKRLARTGTQFNIIKFRTMAEDLSGQDAITIFHEMGRDDLVEEYIRERKIKDDPRITAFGHFLRGSSMDELPQFLHVLSGRMSLVGPRPYLPDEIDQTQEEDLLLLVVKPGLTSLWAALGRSELSFEERKVLDLYYVEHWSFWQDLKILLKTIPVVFSGRGAT